MVAPSFANLERLSEPFEENGKEYILVKTKSGTTRKVRWYEEPMKKIRPLKEVLGFSKGYITIFKGDTYSLLEWFRESTARYHNFWGWYFISDEELPETPAGVTPIQLKWEDVAMVDEDQLKTETAIKDHLATLLYDESPSEYQGAIGDRLELEVLVIKAIDLPDGYYGSSTMYIMSDADENQYVWTTSSKKLEEGENYTLRGTVKEHKTYKRIRQTVLTRCMLR